jgi:hypothetical protein
MRVSDFLNLNNNFANEQFGFRKHTHSLDKALFSFTDEILCDVCNKMYVSWISCDIAKAFDCVNYEI